MARDIHDFCSQGQIRIAATLIALGETLRVVAVATIDVNDFSAYRFANGKAPKLVF